MPDLVLFAPLKSLLRLCEVNCVVACCGRDAFDHDPKHLMPWLREHPEQFPLVLDQLSDVLRWAGDHSGVLISEGDEFNAVWNTSGECVAYLRGWRDTILEAAKLVYGTVPAIDPAWRTSDVVALARGIYDDRAFDRMPILADAFQDAGCNNDDILNHCRDTDTPHARGCWVVDLVLGKV